MIRSMFTAISSLNLHQKYLDVVSNNLANANTTGYKSSRVLFQDQFAQMMAPGSAPSATQGGINPTQIGLGVGMGFVSPDFTQGTLQSTGRNLDLGVEGDGFFVYGQDASRRYSREGSMGLDADGYLVNAATGLRTQGWMADATGAVDPNAPVDDIQIDTTKSLARATENVALGGNLSSDTDGTGTATVSIAVYDSLGALQNASIRFTRGGVVGTPTNVWTWQVMDTSVTPPVAGTGTGTITFDANGQVSTTTPPTVTTPATIPGSAGSTTPIPVTFDFTKMTQLKATTSATVTSQDGLAAGSVTDVYISPNDGGVSLVYSNGLSEKVGQVALARFTNPAGLIQSEGTTYMSGLNSGEPEIGAASSGGRGTIASGHLEASNVDMAQEFTNMILAQRGFQASSRVITTSDEILQELVNLKR
ncbi:MAG TPA: flagellar hook protein FlgE [Anaerolineales bacterium]|nr:flagellar hook protein FlgE [Anaerolineales bacterium]HNC90358.1 flagellar hook protein FlgE [Anaerolineales bacterium]HND93154.1 flagellar hook protein FlgE [Anaerolineales bacterium]